MEIKIDDIANGELSTEESAALQVYFKEGGTWKDLLQLSEQEIEGIYAQAYKYYEKKEFEQALGAFSTLIQLNPYEVKYWLGIGATLQLKGEYDEALSAYKLVFAIEENHSAAHFYSAQCLFALGKNQECIDHLQKVLSSSALTGQHVDLAIKALEILQILEKGGTIV